MADEARRNAEEIEENVNNWLDETSKILIEENESANMKCFKGLCPNPKKRYQESKKAVKKAKAVAGLYEEGKVDRISYKADAGPKQYQAHIQVFMNGNNNNLHGAHIVTPNQFGIGHRLGSIYGAGPYGEYGQRTSSRECRGPTVVMDDCDITLAQHNDIF
ncbi:hypothetical protein Dsin_023844 [Dipteronia sinensis]|uniref:Uncharacterized protein n=1 Tax=Dipteronia sinensis TaxID=43782 RepID=A0AAE0A5L8_9ROSI|nr:hypothetical protein Dsin_023844 [Dipteronia sinensis]